MGITCVLAANQKQKTIAYFYCLYEKCTREYKVHADSVYEEFSVEWLGIINHSKRGVVRPLNGISRIKDYLQDET